jgi:hypothetical protein
VAAAYFLLLHRESPIFVEMTEQPCREFDFAGQAAIDFHETLLLAIDYQRSLHVMEDLRRARSRPKRRIWLESQTHQISGLALKLKLKSFGEGRQQVAFLLAVFARFLLLGPELLRMRDQCLNPLILVSHLGRVEFPAIHCHNALKVPISGLTYLKSFTWFAVLLLVLAIAPQRFVIQLCLYFVADNLAHQSVGILSVRFGVCAAGLRGKIRTHAHAKSADGYIK